ADATLQYIKGTEGNWWPTPLSADKYLKSPFNTYQHTGLPPHPINNPSLESIAAVLNPESTNCLFYLHDASHDIHCSVTYGGQKSNVNKYLK
ncbi:MAG: endolytic transglycosylase MltG, partial [Candidatus Paceibacterota bacterium]